MSRAPSLQELMRDMTRRLDSYDAYGACDDDQQSSVSIELESFLAVDPILADLYKQYLDAKQRYEELMKCNGQDDPMAEVALDVMESAESAIETRLIELREDKKIVIEALYQRKLLLKARQSEIQRNAYNYKERLQAFYQRGSAKFQTEQEAKDDYFLMMLLWFWLSSLTRRAVHSLSLADAFRSVSLNNKIAAMRG